MAKQKLRDVIELYALTIPPTNTTSAQLVARAAAMADAAQFYGRVFMDAELPDDFVPSTAGDFGVFLGPIKRDQETAAGRRQSSHSEFQFAGR